MIFEEIVLHNFRVYRDRQRINLQPRSPKKPIVLIGGLNGGGKTTLLMGLQLGLFGRASNVWRATCSSYDEFLRQSIHRAVSAEDGAGIEVQFRYVQDGAEQSIRILRYWRAAGQSMRESVEVLRDGELDTVLSGHWAEWVEDFVPPRISPLFFFDGEKIEELADPDRSFEILSTAIQSLLGLDLVDQLATDLKVFERRKRKDLSSEDSCADFEALERDLERVEEALKLKAQDRAAAESEVGQIKKRLGDINQELKKHGGAIYAKAAELRAEHSLLKDRKRELEERLRELASDCLPFLLCHDLLSDCRSQADGESSSSVSHATLDVLADRDTRLLKAVQEKGAARKTVAFLQKFLATDLKERRAQSEPGEVLLELSADSTHRLRHLLDAELPSAQRSARELVAQLEDCGLSIENVDRKLAGLPDEETVQPLLAKQSEIETALTKATAKRDVLLDQLEQARRQVEQATYELEKAKREEEDFIQNREDDNRLLVHSQRARRTLDLFRDQILAKHITRIEGLVLESFQKLLRKQRLVQDIRIDPETYRIQIQDKQHGTVLPESLSAGERQLLATSMLWGLSRASGRRLPVVIDTPLGRLDNSHRGNLIDRYFPYASHQVILLSTDEEIDAEFAERIQPWVGREYRLDFDDRLQATTAVEGYFE